MKKDTKKKDAPIKIDASFEELVKMSVEGNPKPKPKEEKKVTLQDKVNAALKLQKLVKKAREYKNKKAEG